jgi:hypothetical protein
MDQPPAGAVRGRVMGRPQAMCLGLQ